MRFASSFLFASFLAARSLVMPLSFEQRDSRHFLARLAGGTVELCPDRVIFGDVTLRFRGAASGARMEGLGPAAPSTYLRAGVVRTFAQFPKVAIRNLYPGIDAVFYASGENLEYDLRIAAGVSPDRIRISVEGARSIRIDSQGNLTVETASGILQQRRPRVLQGNREVAARYVRLAANEAGIQLGKHDRRLPLTVDPVLSYVNTLGNGGFSQAGAIATDAQGNIYVAGQTNSATFPTTSSAFDPKFPPQLRVASNAGQTISPLQVGAAASVSVVGGTPDGAVLYAATSSGILLSGDSGATWRPTLPLPVTATVLSIALDASDPATILVATNRGLFGSDSGGQLGWGLRDTGLPVSGSGYVWVTSAFYDPNNPYIAYATSYSPSYLFKSTDAGNTWMPLDPTYPGEPPVPTDPYLPVAATLSQDGSVLYTIDGNGTLFKSADGGASWVKLAEGLRLASPPGNALAAIQVDPTNANTLYVLDEDGLQKSTDGGVTFSKVRSPTSVKQFVVDSSGTLYAGGFNLLYVSTDGGITFAPLPQLASYDVTGLSVLGANVYLGSQTPPVPFVIKLDPSGSNVLYSTFLGGSAGDGASGLAVDSQGNAVLVGYTISPDFPLTAPTANPPSPGDVNQPAKSDGFIAKLSADGTHLIYSTLLGASKSVQIQAVGLDSSGAVFVTGYASSGDFPTTANAFQPAIPTGSCTRVQGNPLTAPVNPGRYAFVSKLSADGGSLVYSTFLTGACGSAGLGLAVDAAGDAIVAGVTTSPDFPVSSKSYQPAFPGPAGQPTPPAIYDAGFVSKLSPAGDKLLASTYLGGGYSTQGNAVALDAGGNAYITGFTQGFATGATPGAFQSMVIDRCTPPFFIGPSLPYTGTGDAFVLKLDATLSSAGFLTYLGGACSDTATSIALDAARDIWVGGSTGSADFPVKNPFQACCGGFVSELSPDASQLLFSSFSDGTYLALSAGAVYLAGTSNDSALVEKIDPSMTSAIGIDTVGPVVVSPPASVGPYVVPTSIAPGQLVQITGRNLGPAASVAGTVDASGRLPFILAGATVFFDNIPAPLMSVQAASIVCFVPFETGLTTQITVLSNGQRSNGFRTAVVASAPQILSIVNQDGTTNSAAHPARAGSVISLYVSGLGETTPLSVDGLVNAAPLPVPLATVQVFSPALSSNSPVTPRSVAAAPGMIAGITQVTVAVPATLRATSNPVSIGVNSANASLYVSQ